jgi:ribosome-binding protein aMBF1 (putative translation factor)
MRLEKGLSQVELADMIKTKPSAIGRYQKNEAKPSIEMLLKFAKNFGISLDSLVDKTNLKFEFSICPME